MIVILFGWIKTKSELYFNLPHLIKSGHLATPLEVAIYKDGKVTRDTCYLSAPSSAGAQVSFVEVTKDPINTFQPSIAIFKVTDANKSVTGSCHYDSFLFRGYISDVLDFVAVNDQ
ncbi:MAG: hypothetical protein HAW67_03920 [Endozoicomonadaceae bacterium]|nr:hypothetical protein [Endozoicomonadaceae bacterium]